MITAGARTNAIGSTISGIDSAIGAIQCKTEHLKIDCSTHTKGMFLPANNFVNKHGINVLGSLIGSNNDEIDLIARSMFEAGVNLRSKVCLMVYERENKKTKIEIWTVGRGAVRYMAYKGRVYGHKR